MPRRNRHGRRARRSCLPCRCRYRVRHGQLHSLRLDLLSGGRDVAAGRGRSRNWRVAIQNFWEIEELSQRLQSAAPPVLSWSDLRTASEIQFGHLTFSRACFDPLQGLPFSGASATRIRALLNILDRFAVAFGPDGTRSAEGHRIYQEYFTGRNALFSDSSDTEKREFGKDLRFRHLDQPGEALSCTWHGKVRHMTLRIHFSWPIRPDTPLYVMYIGQKITRR